MTSLAKALGRFGLVSTNVRKTNVSGNGSSQKYVSLEKQSRPIEKPATPKIVPDAFVTSLPPTDFVPIETMGRLRFVSNLLAAMQMTELTLAAYKNWQRDRTNDRVFDIALSAMRLKLCDFVSDEASRMSKRFDLVYQRISESKSGLSPELATIVGRYSQTFVNLIGDIQKYGVDEKMAAACTKFWSTMATVVNNHRKKLPQADVTADVDGQFFVVRFGLNMIKLLDQLSKPAAAQFFAALSIGSALAANERLSQGQWDDHTRDIDALNSAALPIITALGDWMSTTEDSFASQLEQKQHQAEADLLTSVFSQLIKSGNKLGKRLAKLIKKAVRLVQRADDLKVISGLLAVYQSEVLGNPATGPQAVNAYVDGLPTGYPKEDVRNVIAVVDSIVAQERDKAASALKKLQEDTDTKRKELEKKVAMKSDELDQYWEQIVGLQEQLDNAAQNLRTLDSELNASKADYEKATQEANLLQKKIDEAAAQMKRADEEFRLLRTDYEQSVMDREKAAADGEELHRELEQKRAEISQLQSSLEDATKREQALNQQLENVGKLTDKEAANLSNQLTKAQDDVAKLETMLEDSRKFLTDAIQIAAEKTIDLDALSKKHDRYKRMVTAAIDEKLKRIAKLEFEMDEMRRIHGDDGDRLSQLGKELEAKVAKLRKLETKAKKYAEQVEVLKKDYDALILLVTEVASSMNIPVGTHPNDTLRNVLDFVKKLITERKEYVSRTKELETLVASHEATIRDDNALIHELQEELQDALQSKSKADEQIREVKSKYDSDIADLRAKIQQVSVDGISNAQLDEVKAAANKQIDELTATYENRVAQLEEKLKQTEELALQKEKALGQATTRNKELSQKAAVAEAKWKELGKSNDLLHARAKQQTKVAEHWQRFVQPFQNRLKETAIQVSHITQEYEFPNSASYINIGEQPKLLGTTIDDYNELRDQMATFMPELVTGFQEMVMTCSPLITDASGVLPDAEYRIAYALIDWNIFPALRSSIDYLIKYLCQVQFIEDAALRFTYSDSVSTALAIMFIGVVVKHFASSQSEYDRSEFLFRLLYESALVVRLISLNYQQIYKFVTGDDKKNDAKNTRKLDISTDPTRRPVEISRHMVKTAMVYIPKSYGQKLDLLSSSTFATPADNTLDELMLKYETK